MHEDELNENYTDLATITLFYSNSSGSLGLTFQYFSFYPSVYFFSNWPILTPLLTLLLVFFCSNSSSPLCSSIRTLLDASTFLHIYSFHCDCPDCGSSGLASVRFEHFVRNEAIWQVIWKHILFDTGQCFKLLSNLKFRHWEDANLQSHVFTQSEVILRWTAFSPRQVERYGSWEFVDNSKDTPYCFKKIIISFFSLQTRKALAI